MPARQQTQVLTAIKPLPVSNTPEKPPGRRLHVSVKHSSEISSSSSSAPSTPKELENLVPEVTITTLDIDSKSSPPIMHQRDQHTEIITQPQSTRKPTSITFTQPIATLATSSRVTVPESTFTTSEESRPGFRLSHLRPPWGDKRQNIYRSVSSPHLTTNPVLPLPLPENQPKPKPSALDKKQSMKTLRKAPSVLSNPRKCHLYVFDTELIKIFIYRHCKLPGSASGSEGGGQETISNFADSALRSAILSSSANS